MLKYLSKCIPIRKCFGRKQENNEKSLEKNSTEIDLFIKTDAIHSDKKTPGMCTEIEQSKDKLIEQETLIEHLRTIIENLKEELNNLENRNRMNEDYRRKFEESSTILKDLKDKLSVLNSTSNTYTEERTALNKEIEDLKFKLARNEEKEKSLQNELLQKDYINSNLSSDLNNLKNKLVTIEISNQSMKNSFSNSISTLESEKKSLEYEKAVLQSEKLNLNISLTTATEKSEKLLSEIEKYKNEKNAQDKIRQNIMQSNAKISGESKICKDENNKFKAEIADLQNKLNVKENELDELKVRFEASYKEVTEAEVSNLKAELSTLIKDKETQSKEIENLLKLNFSFKKNCNDEEYYQKIIKDLNDRINELIQG